LYKSSKILNIQIKDMRVLFLFFSKKCNELLVIRKISSFKNSLISNKNLYLSIKNKSKKEILFLKYKSKKEILFLKNKSKKEILFLKYKRVSYNPKEVLIKFKIIEKVFNILK